MSGTKSMNRETMSTNKSSSLFMPRGFPTLPQWVQYMEPNG